MNIPSKVQYRMFQYAKELFPANEDLLTDYFHPELIYKESEKPMQLDIFIPSLKLAFEYQGIMQHSKSSLRRTAL